MFALTESVHAPVVDPTAADGVYSLLWLVVALPLAGAAILLVGGRFTDKWGHLLGALLPVASFDRHWARWTRLTEQLGGDPARLDGRRRHRVVLTDRAGAVSALRSLIRPDVPTHVR